MSPTPPFDDYPASPGTVESYVTTLTTTSTDLSTLRDDVSAQAWTAAFQTEGLLPDLTVASVDPVLTSIADVRGASTVTGGVLRLWSAAITTYNDGVAELNRQWAVQQAFSFGVPATDEPGPGETAQELETERDGKIATARTAEINRLTTELRRLEDALDDEATRAARLLDEGPTDDVVEELFTAGGLTLGDLQYFPGVDFAELDVRAAVNAMVELGTLPAGTDPEAVIGGLSGVTHLLGADTGVNGNRDDIYRLMERLAEMTPAERGAVVALLSDDELDALNSMVTDTDGDNLNPFDHNGLEHWGLMDFNSLLLSGVPAALIDRYQTHFPWTQPGFDTTDGALEGQNPQSGMDATGLEYGIPPGTVWDLDADGNPIIDASQQSQGALGDCWYIAGVTAATQVNPDFVPDHMTVNENGTITVTMYDDDGNAHDVTVSPDLPLNSEGEPAFAHGADGELWPGYYEKAFALAYDDDGGGAPDGKEGDDDYDVAENGSYAGLEWDNSGNGVPYYTGSDANDIDTDIDDVRESFESGHGVLVSSHDNDDNVPDDMSDAYVTRHVFYVKGFTDDGDIILGNPWGSDNPDVVMDADEFADNFDNAQELEVP